MAFIVRNPVNAFLFMPLQILLTNECSFIDELTMRLKQVRQIGDFSPEGFDKIIHNPSKEDLSVEAILTALEDLEKLAERAATEITERSSKLEEFIHWARPADEINFEDFRDLSQNNHSTFTSSYPLVSWRGLTLNATGLNERLLSNVLKLKNALTRESAFAVFAMRIVSELTQEVKFDLARGLSAYEIVEKHEDSLTELMDLRRDVNPDKFPYVNEALESIEDTILDVRMNHLMEHPEQEVTL